MSKLHQADPFLTESEGDTDGLHRWSPPPLQDVDFGADYNFDAEPILPSYLHDSGEPMEGIEPGNVAGDSTSVEHFASLVAPSRSAVCVQAGIHQEDHASGDPPQVPARVLQLEAETTAQITLPRRLIAIAPKQNPTKRARSPSPVHSIQAGCYVFSVGSSGSAVVSGRKRQKRGSYARKTCLRCQSQGLKCSGTYPCLNCAKHWEFMERRSQSTIYWTHCFDSDIQELNFLWTRSQGLCTMYNNTLDDEAIANQLLHVTGTEQWPKRLLAVARASRYLWIMAAEASVDAGFAIMFGTNDQEAEANAVKTCSFQGGQPDLIPRRPHSWSIPKCACQVDPVLVLAATHLRPGLICEHAGVPLKDLVEVRDWLSLSAFHDVARLMTIVKKGSATALERTALGVNMVVLKVLAVSKACHNAYFGDVVTILSSAFPEDLESAFDYYNEKPYEKSRIQKNHLKLYCEHWIGKLYGVGRAREYFPFLFCFGVLCRLNPASGLRPVLSPKDQALLFVLRFPDVLDAQALRKRMWALQSAGEEQVEEDGESDLNWIEVLYGDDMHPKGEKLPECACGGRYLSPGKTSKRRRTAT